MSNINSCSSLIGLSLEMFLDQDNYMLKKLSKNAGARVVVHDPNSVPLPDEFGINLQPNTATGVAVQKNDITRLEYPFKTNCTKSWSQTPYNVPRKHTYSLAVSLKAKNEYVTHMQRAFTYDTSISDLPEVLPPGSHRFQLFLLSSLAGAK